MRKYALLLAVLLMISSCTNHTVTSSVPTKIISGTSSSSSSSSSSLQSSSENSSEDESSKAAVASSEAAPIVAASEAAVASEAAAIAAAASEAAVASEAAAIAAASEAAVASEAAAIAAASEAAVASEAAAIAAASEAAVASEAAASEAKIEKKKIVPKQTSLSDVESEILRLQNEERERLGLGTLTYDANLQAAARIRSAELCKANMFAHTRTDGREWYTVLKEDVPYAYTSAGENLGTAEYNDPNVHLATDAAFWVDSWIDSPPHYENMIRAEYNRAGVGMYKVVRDGMTYVYATTIFAYVKE